MVLRRFDESYMKSAEISSEFYTEFGFLEAAF
jgi:hypothetical protein